MFHTDMRMHEQLREAEIEIGRLRTDNAELKLQMSRLEAAWPWEEIGNLRAEVEALKVQLGHARRPRSLPMDDCLFNLPGDPDPDDDAVDEAINEAVAETNAERIGRIAKLIRDQVARDRLLKHDRDGVHVQRVRLRDADGNIATVYCLDCGNERAVGTVCTCHHIAASPPDPDEPDEAPF